MLSLRMPTSENKLKRKASQPIRNEVFLWNFLQVNVAFATPVFVYQMCSLEWNLSDEKLSFDQFLMQS